MTNFGAGSSTTRKAVFDPLEIPMDGTWCSLAPPTGTRYVFVTTGAVFDLPLQPSLVLISASRLCGPSKNSNDAFRSSVFDHWILCSCCFRACLCEKKMLRISVLLGRIPHYQCGKAGARHVVSTLYVYIHRNCDGNIGHVGFIIRQPSSSKRGIRKYDVTCESSIAQRVPPHRNTQHRIEGPRLSVFQTQHWHRHRHDRSTISHFHWPHKIQKSTPHFRNLFLCNLQPFLQHPEPMSC